MTCPSSHVLSRALDGVLEEVLVEHLAACASCTAELAATRDLIAVAREVGRPLPSATRREEVRTMLLAAGRSAEALADATQPRRTRRIALAGASIAVAAAVAIVVLAQGPDTAPHGHATVTPVGTARYLAVASSPDETVWLFDGSIDVEVAPLHASERFRVRLAGAEIEVHGTRFIATARAGTLASVDVAHGIVEVRSGTGSVLLRVGESWHAPAPILTATTTPRPSPVTPAIEAPPAKRSPIRRAKTTAIAIPTAPPVAAAVESLPQERAYDAGWAALRTGRFGDSAREFLRVYVLDPDGPLAEDATYWRAVALARTDQTAQAMAAFRELLDRYPRSPRFGEASTMLGWLLVGANQRTEAARRFRAAIADPNPAVSHSARAGLEAVTTK